MSPPRTRALVVLLLAAAAFTAAHALRPTTYLSAQRPALELERVFPRAFGDWAVDDRVRVQLVAPDQQALLARLYHQTLARTYVNRRGERIMLSVAYGGDQSDATRAHRPEVCYPAQGFQIEADDRTRLDLSGGHAIVARRLLARQGARSEPITYWITVGDRATASGTAQKLAQLRYGVRGLIPDGMLVRVSSIDPDPERAYGLQREFVDALRTAVPGAWRDRVFGRDLP